MEGGRIFRTCNRRIPTLTRSRARSTAGDGYRFATAHATIPQRFAVRYRKRRRSSKTRVLSSRSRSQRIKWSTTFYFQPQSKPRIAVLPAHSARLPQTSAFLLRSSKTCLHLSSCSDFLEGPALRPVQRTAAGDVCPPWQAGDPQHRSGQPVHRRGVHWRADQRRDRRQPWTAGALGGTTCSSSGFGAALNTRWYICGPTKASARPRFDRPPLGLL